MSLNDAIIINISRMCVDDADVDYQCVSRVAVLIWLSTRKGPEPPEPRLFFVLSAIRTTEFVEFGLQRLSVF